MQIFDCHFHIENGTDDYNIEVAGRNIIFNSFDSYYKFKNHVTDADSVTLIFDYRNHFEDIMELLETGKVNALKIHNRIQKISAADYPVLLEQLDEAKPTVPIIVDAFYFGDDLEFQPNLGNIIAIAKRLPDVPVIVAHCGGIEILKYFYHMKSLQNIYFDLSFSLAYLRHSSVYIDYKNLVKHGNPARILFGTDYPYVSPAEQLNAFMEITRDTNIPAATVEKMLFTNAQQLFKG